MHPRPSNSHLLSSMLATDFVMTESGRLLCDNGPNRAPAPGLYITGCESGNLVRLRHDVGAATAREIEVFVADETRGSGCCRAARALRVARRRRLPRVPGPG